MHCYNGLFFFFHDRQPGRPGLRLDWAGIGWRDTASRYDDLIRPRGLTDAFSPLFFYFLSVGWRQRTGSFKAVGSTAGEFVG